MSERWRRLKHPKVVRQATFVAIVVGTLLNLVNNNGIFFGETLTLVLATKIGLTYVVPYSVSTYGQVFGAQLTG
jgi:hypothetical protein